MNGIGREIANSGTGTVETVESGAVAKRFVFSRDFAGFSGHFPGHPILPAFVQIMAARAVFEEAKGGQLRPAAVERAKFHAPITPDTEVTISCRERQLSGKTVCDAQLEFDGKTASVFRLVFE